MLRDNLADSFYPYLENPRPTRPDPSLTEYVISPFQAEPAHPNWIETAITAAFPIDTRRQRDRKLWRTLLRLVRSVEGIDSKAFAQPRRICDAARRARARTS